MLSQSEVTSIANSLIPKVKFMASKIYWQSKKRVPKEDLEQEGMLALLKALRDRFNPDLGIRPWTFAEPAVVGAMKDMYCKSKPRTWHSCVNPAESAPVNKLFTEATSDRGAAARVTDSQILANQLINKLAGQTRMVIERRYLDDIPVGVIAQEMGLHPTRVPQIEAKAMTFMAAELGHVYGGRRKKCSHRRPSIDE